MREWERK